MVSTQAPSVSAYFVDAWKGVETLQVQVMLAELITEAVCREIARQGVEKGTFLAPTAGQADAIQREYIRLQNQYAHRIHSCFVDSFEKNKAPARRGRPSREETITKAVASL